MVRLVKLYDEYDSIRKEYERDDFLECLAGGYDNYIFTYNGQDYMIGMRWNRKRKKEEWFLCDALEGCTLNKPKPLTDLYPSLDAILVAPLLDGKTIADRCSELRICADFWLEDDGAKEKDWPKGAKREERST